jgi:hypothetical protein
MVMLRIFLKESNDLELGGSPSVRVSKPKKDILNKIESHNVAEKARTLKGAQPSSILQELELERRPLYFLDTFTYSMPLIPFPIEFGTSRSDFIRSY